MKKILIFTLFVASFFVTGVTSALSLPTQEISLNTGWNIISTPRIIELHQFSASENSSNFDIYILNASSTSGWSTMAEFGQVEFIPLYGYFINNKTGSTQTLTLTYKEELSPNERFFERKFTKTGWYSIGVANPTYARAKNATTADTNNVANILDSLSGSHSSVIDFTESDFNTIPSSVRVGETWKSVVPGDLNSLNDIRETKGYAVYITKENALYSGFQNTDYQPLITEISPAAATAGTENFVLTVTGWNFTPSSTVRWNGFDRATTYSSSTQISALILASDVSVATTTKITVSNPGLNGGISSEYSFTINASSGTLSLSLASDSPTSAVVPGATSVILAKFTVRPTGENYEVRQVKFYIATSTNASAVDLTGTVYVKVNGSTVMSKAIADISNTAATAHALASYPILTAGQDATITVEGSVSSSATSVSTYQVTSFQVSQAKRIVTNDIVSNPTGTANGNSIAVKAAALVITTLSTPVANSVVAGTNSYEFATIQLNAQAGGEDVKVSKIVVTHNGSSTVDSDIGTYYLYKDSDTTPLSTSAATAELDGTPDGIDDTLTFNFANYIMVTRGTPVTLHLKANILSSATAGSSSRFNVASSTTAVTAVGVSTGNTLTHGSNITYSGNGQVTTIVPGGQLTLSLMTGGPSVSQIVNVGTNDGVYFAFKLTSQYETQKITSLKLTATSTGSTGLAITTLNNIRLYEGSPSGTPIATASQFDTCDVSKCTVTFAATDNILSAPAPTTGVTLYVKANIASGGSARLGDNFKFTIADAGDVAVKGSVTASTSGEIIGTPTQGGVSYITPFRVVVEGISPTTATTVGTGAGVTVGVFKVTNNGGSAINLASTTTFG
ncbi:MAG: hypothetical protein Q7R98_00005, partial [Candidatus Jorgensenbacteria bacterium]|nr:hypothetical protein [Candidatus Jorgensenbacteria bacterium]